MNMSAQNKIFQYWCPEAIWFRKWKKNAPTIRV